MKTARILSINFSELSQPGFVAKAGEINTAIHAPGFADDFPTITPAAEAVAAALLAFSDAVTAETSRTVTALRKATRDELTRVLTLLALDLEQQADGDMLKLSRTGYDINKRTGGQTYGNTPTPRNLRLSHGLTRQVLGKITAIPGKTLYIVAHSYDPINGPWTVLDPLSNSQKLIVSGLDRGKDVYIKVMATGPHGPSDWSDIATILVN